MDELTTSELREIFKSCKRTKFDKEPDFTLVQNEVCSKMDVQAGEKLLADLKDLFVKLKTTDKKNQAAWSGNRSIDDYACLSRKDYVSRPRRPVNEVGDRQQRRRLSDYIEATSSKAAEENVSPTKLYAYGLTTTYLKKKNVAKIGKSILNNDEISSYVPIEIASAIFEIGKMSKRVYTDIRLLLKNAGANVLPTYETLDAFRKERRPYVQELEEPFKGVKFDYEQCLKLSTVQLIRSLDLPLFNLNEVNLFIHDGLDGSGGHSIFNQKGCTETNNIIMYMFRIEKMKDLNNNIIYETSSHASSTACRPLMLLMGKETRENCEIVSSIQQERRNLQFEIEHCGRTLKVNTFASMSMIDGKLHSLLTGLGGAFCCLCTNSKEECRDIDNITSGFKINRSLEETLAICQEGVHLNRKPGDYNVRQGVTQVPVSIEDINSLHPLHALLRCFGWLYKICYHSTASHMSWSEAKLNVSNQLSRALDFLKLAKEEIQTRVKAETSICLEKPDPTGHGGTTTTGNVVKVMLNTNHRKLLTAGITNSELKVKVDEIILNMAVILTIINSDMKVKIAEYTEFCRETHLLVRSIDWIEFSPSAHSVLAHSSELIEGNNGRGLLNFSECGLEANNKFLRQYRINHARKTSQFDNLTDCINRLWDKSDPMVSNVRERIQCRHCKVKGHTTKSCKELRAAFHSCNSEYESLISFLTYQ